MANYVTDLQPELEVNYCRLVVVWTDDPASTRAPLVLIPAYLVPFFDMLHVVALFRARWLLTRSTIAA